MSETAPPTETLESDSRRSIGARRNPASQEAILDAATEILREEGLGGFSIEAVARRARAGKPTIYRWWPNRTRLLLDVYQRFKDARPFPDTGNLRGDLIAFLDTQLIGFWKDRLCGTVYRAIIAEAQTDDDAARALVAYQAERKARATLFLDRARARGEIGAGIDAALIIDLLVGFAWHHLLTGSLDRAQAQIPQVVDRVLAGLIRP